MSWSRAQPSYFLIYIGIHKRSIFVLQGNSVVEKVSNMKYFFLVMAGIGVLSGIWLLSPAKQPSVIINGHTLEVEVVRTPEEQARGLSGRESLAENAGMLFVYETPVTPGFWMKDMNFPLDIIWIGSDKRIVDISENIAPETFPQLFRPLAPVQYVLEVNAGWAEAHNLSMGNTAKFQVDL